MTQILTMVGFNDLSEQQRWFASYIVITLQTEHLNDICSSSIQRHNNNLPYGKADVKTNPIYAFVKRNLIPTLKKSFDSHCSGSTKSEWLRKFCVPEEYSPLHWLKKNKYIRDLTEHEHQDNSTRGHPPEVNPSYSPIPPKMSSTMNMNGMKESLNAASEADPDEPFALSKYILTDGQTGHIFFWGPISKLLELPMAEISLILKHAKTIHSGENTALKDMWCFELDAIKNDALTANVDAVCFTLYDVDYTQLKRYKMGFGVGPEPQLLFLQVPSLTANTKRSMIATLGTLQNRTTGHPETSRTDQYQQLMRKLEKAETKVREICM